MSANEALIYNYDIGHLKTASGQPLFADLESFGGIMVPYCGLRVPLLL